MKPSKYRNVRTEVDGITFASKAEARRYLELKLLVRAGKISGLKLQPRYPLNAEGGAKIATYVADFEYVSEFNGQTFTEDVKGVETPAFRLKAKLFEAQYGRKIALIKSGRRSQAPIIVESIR
jgi:hypothetical protein